MVAYRYKDRWCHSFRDHGGTDCTEGPAIVRNVVNVQLLSGGPEMVASSGATLAISPTRPTNIDLLGREMHVTLRFSNPSFQLCGF